MKNIFAVVFALALVGLPLSGADARAAGFAVGVSPKLREFLLDVLRR